MKAYKDKVFCKFYLHCKDGKNCPDALTPEVKAKAAEWWKEVSQWGPDRDTPVKILTVKKLPDCYIDMAQAELFD